MDDYENEALPVGEAQVAEAMQTCSGTRRARPRWTSVLWITSCGSAWAIGRTTRTP